MILLLSLILYVACGVGVAAFLKDDIGSRVEEGVIAIVFWPVFLVVFILLKLAELLGYR